MAKSGKRHLRKSKSHTGSLDDAPRTRPARTAAARRRRKVDPDAASDAPVLAPDRLTPADGVREPARQHALHEDVVSELATCLWYLKTKYFKKQWLDEESADPDPRARRALRRLHRAIRALEGAGIRLVDPTGTRYPPGGEAMMTPLQFEPTAGLATDTVSETAQPMVFSGNRLIQRGEVFVSVPVRNHAMPDDSDPRT